MMTHAGIPGSFLDPDTRLLRWLRGPDHLLAPGQVSRSYHARVSDGQLTAIVSRDLVPDTPRPLWHLSISFRDTQGLRARYPSWDEIKSAKYQLIPDDVVMVLIFPRRQANYVDVVANCLHLWQSSEKLDE